MSYKTEPDNRAGLLTSQIFEFHISRKAREYFKFDETLFTLSGDLIFPNVRAAQAFAARMNEANKAIFGKNSSPVSSGDLNAMGVYHEVVHFVINSYVSQVNPAAFLRLENWLRKNIGAAELERSTRKFVELFPATPVYRGEEAAENYLSRSVGTLPNRHVAMTELILLWLENRNPSFTPILPLIDDGDLNVESKYNDIVSDADNFFDTQPRFPYVSLPLLKMLRAPAEAYPNSISEQLQFMAKHWEKILNKSPYLLKLLTAVDIIKEEGKYFLMLDQARSDKNKIPRVAQADFFGFGEKESQAVLRFKGHEYEAENFSQDLGWMPRVVLIAKNAFVWLDQLGRKYGRAMTRLDQIPDEELDILASRGFTGLWLIGIWTRSFASQRIKQFNGNSDAIASAYSLNSYDIASDLGGYEAYGNLKDRAFRYGIRLASDMVPNHMGIDSAWVINHPDWFLSSEYPPFPNYTFNGPDLSNDDRVGIFIEDGYWSKRDAAVVFKRLDRWTGDVRYIYHGNDGTHMPWNDTAQLDFTNPEVREAVIQTIVHVARMFPIIRFDAAMVLSKKHYQRLWFPEPGTGGSIPSRANFSMTKDQFDAAIPNEFWREVVDRVQKEVPDTLLLAEAFWLMEGYFVRTLGMHRVYNSAFMNMLKKEENANYRQVIKNILEYNPQILKRFVNFVNNPDEETAIAQFGKDDKYFGICTMMTTMPGLPMFGHGQIEGFTEKYGMEFKRAYRDEHADEDLVARHKREIFPLLRKRNVFSEMDDFVLYDLFTGDGTVNEDVFAYSNGFGDGRSLVVYNNRYSHAAGWIRTSVRFRNRSGKMVQRNLTEGLAINGDGYCIFQDVMTGLEYIRQARTLKKNGLYVELEAFKYNVFMNFREVESSREKPYDELCKALDGRGVGSIENQLLDFVLRDVHRAFYETMNAGSLRYLFEGINNGKLKPAQGKVFVEKLNALMLAVADYEQVKKNFDPLVAEKYTEFKSFILLRDLMTEPFAKKLGARFRLPHEDSSLQGWRILFLWLFLDGVKRYFTNEKKAVYPLDDYRLVPKVVTCFSELGVNGGTSNYESRIVREVLENIGAEIGESLQEMLIEAMKRKSTQDLLGVNMYDGISWFNKEQFEDFLDYFALTYLLRELASRVSRERETSGRIYKEKKVFLKDVVSRASEIEKLAAKANYRLDDFVDELERI